MSLKSRLKFNDGGIPLASGRYRRSQSSLTPALSSISKRMAPSASTANKGNSVKLIQLGLLPDILNRFGDILQAISMLSM
jgi:hypothetical protein